MGNIACADELIPTISAIARLTREMNLFSSTIASLLALARLACLRV